MQFQARHRLSIAAGDACCQGRRGDLSDAKFAAAQSFFLLATADADGRPERSFKGGPAGLARVLAPAVQGLPDDGGNVMFKSLGNVTANPQVGLPFIAMGEAPRRLRENGRAEVVCDDPLKAELRGAQLSAFILWTSETALTRTPGRFSSASSD